MLTKQIKLEQWLHKFLWCLLSSDSCEEFLRKSQELPWIAAHRLDKSSMQLGCNLLNGNSERDRSQSLNWICSIQWTVSGGWITRHLIIKHFWVGVGSKEKREFKRNRQQRERRVIDNFAEALQPLAAWFSISQSTSFVVMLFSTPQTVKS